MMQALNRSGSLHALVPLLVALVAVVALGLLPVAAVAESEPAEEASAPAAPAASAGDAAADAVAAAESGTPEGAAAGAGQKPAHLVVYRRGVGERDADRWVPATSTGGGFAVRLPNPYTDLETHAVVAEDWEGIVHLVRTRKTGGFGAVQNFVASCAIPDGEYPTAQQTIDASTREHTLRGWLKYRRPVALEGHPEAVGTEFFATDDSRRTHVRMYWMPDRICVLRVEAASFAAASDENIQLFFDSFRLETD